MAIVYERPAEPFQGWSAKSWSSTDLAAILKNLKSAYPWPDTDDDTWEAGDIKLATGDPGPMKTFEKGLLSDNFLASIAEAAHNDIVAEVAKNLGWEAADVGFDKWSNGTGCTQAATLESYTRSFAVCDATTDSALAAATMLDFRAGISDLFCDFHIWWCISVTVGPPYAAPGYSTLQCGPIVRSETAPYDTTETVNIVTNETRTVHHSGETCFSQTCFGVDERKKTVTDSCDGTTITIIERTTNAYLKKCCLTGNGIGWGPNGQPACQLGPATLIPGSHDWLPVP